MNTALAQAMEEEMLFHDDSIFEDDLLFGSDDDHDDIDAPISRGSKPGRVKTLPRNRVAGHDQLFADYFAPNPTYSPNIFARRFRMRLPLFLRIAAAVEDKDPWFKHGVDATGDVSFSPLQKSVAAIQLLAYGYSSDAVDGYLRMSASTASLCLEKFCAAAINIYKDTYLRAPNAADISRILAINAVRGFPGMLGSLDCTHWVWKNCPVAWAGQYLGKEKKATVVLEAVATADLWIWHAFFGVPGSRNDLNVLNQSHLFHDLAAGTTPPVAYTVEGHEYQMGYYLSDGIYPSWPTLVQPFPTPITEKEKHFNKRQEAIRKDIERAFGVLKSRFAILANPARQWHRQQLHDIMITCIILHNMIIEDERNLPRDQRSLTPSDAATVVPIGRAESERDWLHRHLAIRERNEGRNLRMRLMKHAWRLKGDSTTSQPFGPRSCNIGVFRGVNTIVITHQKPAPISLIHHYQIHQPKQFPAAFLGAAPVGRYR